MEHEFITTNYGVLNDLALVDDDELYVTQFLAMRHPLHGPTQPDGVLEHLRLYGSMLLLMLQISPAPIIRCTGEKGKGSPTAAPLPPSRPRSCTPVLFPCKRGVNRGARRHLLRGCMGILVVALPQPPLFLFLDVVVRAPSLHSFHGSFVRPHTAVKCL